MSKQKTTQPQTITEKYAFLESVFQGIAAAIFVIDVDDTNDFRYAGVNPTLERLTGLKLTDFQGKRPEDLAGAIPPENISAIRENYNRCLQAGTTIEYEEMIPINGRETLWLTHLSPLRKGNERIHRIIGTSTDISSLKRTENELYLQLERLSAVRKIGTAITGGFSPKAIFNMILAQAAKQLSVDAANILIFNRDTRTLDYAAGIGFRTPAFQFTKLNLGEGYAGRAALEQKIVHVPNLQNRNTDFLRSPHFSSEGFVVYFGVPLTAQNQIQGVLEVFHRASIEPNPDWMNFLEVIGGQAAIALDLVNLTNGLERLNAELVLAYETTLEGWSRALDMRDKETEGHTQRVTLMGMTDEEIIHLRRGALLHDIGKMGIPDHILQKADALSEKEWEIMRMHPTFAYDMISPIAYLAPSLDIPYCHHEKWNGSGYPRGLKGDEIPLAARVFAVVDVYDALISDRPYRKAWPEKDAIDYIRAQAGEHFDPRVVEIFIWNRSIFFNR